MSEKKEYDGVETTGHEWDGIEELNNPLPRWWVWVFYATIVWAIGYSIAYPAWPGIKSSTAGLLGYSTRANVAEDIAAVNEQNAALRTELAGADLAALVDNRDSDVYSYAVNGGRAVFAANCSQCHGSGANGVAPANGYPNLRDDAWLWGGTVDEIAFTVSHGIRNEQSRDARWSEMPAFGDILPPEEVDQVVQYVLSLSGNESDAALAEAGAEVFDLNCSSCHGAEGMGDQFQGAPNLTDAIWLYGGDEESLTETVMNSRFGVMPAWSDEYRVGAGLSQDEVNAVAVYVHQLGGGQ
ncbi:cytochrome-c oxidase, cbb3-type subunit III [Salibaculum sp.]|uniref:cytochrome-c oxidase, cbb3-type subunit III n=1 Tax=Salibaculum sp. TaxID=2855480 RepID=UPI002B47D17B|nr:cytochrome-c oxidase, cbb3-type subunit III [Salibaculum sp.]HKL69523.1 cytochrome-c oxidase, cbb3-type subunit III [Salibaculum sp.]